MKDLFYAIEDVVVNVLLAPLDFLRELELTSWFSANTISWVFVLVGFVAFIYWMKQLAKYNANNEEDKSVTAHSYL